jgi:hypothetical protein
MEDLGTGVLWRGSVEVGSTHALSLELLYQGLGVVDSHGE